MHLARCALVVVTARAMSPTLVLAPAPMRAKTQEGIPHTTLGLQGHGKPSSTATISHLNTQGRSLRAWWSEKIAWVVPAFATSLSLTRVRVRNIRVCADGYGLSQHICRHALQIRLGFSLAIDIA